MSDNKVMQILRDELGRNPAHAEWASATAQAIADSAFQCNIDPLLVLALIYIESAYKPDAVSSVGARGLMQLMPPTAVECAQETGITYTDGCEYDPVRNVWMGTHYLAKLYRRYRGWWPHALTAYNRGPGKTDALLEKYGGVAPSNVLESYAHLILRKWYGFVRTLNAAPASH